MVNGLTTELHTLQQRVKELEDANGVLDNYNKVTHARHLPYAML